MRCSVRGKAESICIENRSGQRFIACTGHCIGCTSCSSTNGGPSAMSSAFVPGRIRREAPVSTALPGNLACSSNTATPGDAGPSWSSAMGGGDGRRGDEAGECAAIVEGRVACEQRSDSLYTPSAQCYAGTSRLPQPCLKSAFQKQGRQREARRVQSHPPQRSDPALRKAEQKGVMLQ